MAEQQQHQGDWPGWDASLGAPPVIHYDASPDPAQQQKFEQVLDNIAALSRSQTAHALRDQLRNVSGETLHVTLMDEHDLTELNNLTQAGTARNQFQPSMQFNAESWGKYPAAGAQEIVAPSTSLPAKLQLQASYGPDASTEPAMREINQHYRGQYSAYGIAPPEQQFIHELGHYIEFNKAKAAFDDALSHYSPGTKFPDPGDPVYSKIDAILRQGTDEAYVIRTYENPSMRSAVPGYVERDTRYYGGGMQMPEGVKGIPELEPGDQDALKRALGARPHQVQGKVDQPEQALAAHELLTQAARQIGQSALSESEKREYYAAIAQSMNRAGLYVEEQHESVVTHTTEPQRT